MVFFKYALPSFILKVEALAWQSSTERAASACHSARPLFCWLESRSFYIQFALFENKLLSHSLSYEDEPTSNVMTLSSRAEQMAHEQGPRFATSRVSVYTEPRGLDCEFTHTNTRTQHTC